MEKNLNKKRKKTNRSLSDKAKVVVLIAVSFTICMFIIIGFSYGTFNGEVRRFSEHSLEDAKKSFENLKDNDTKMLSSTLEAFLINDEIRETFVEGDREKLYDLISLFIKV